MANCSASVHAGVSSDARAGCTGEGWTSDVYQRVFLAAQDAVIWQDANRFVASRSLLKQHYHCILTLSRNQAWR